jgi:putative hydrolase of the HAD superfamily
MDQRTLIIDYGGVLTVPAETALAEFASAERLSPAALQAALTRLHPLTLAFERGELAEEPFTAALCHELREGHGVHARESGLLARLGRHFRPVPELFEAVRRLRAAGHRTALLANSWARATYPPDAELARLFDVVVLSREVGLRKPDPAVFRLTLDRLRARPADCLFVDDTPANTAAARALGLAAHDHRSTAVTLGLLRSRFAPAADGETSSRPTGGGGMLSAC